MNIEEKYGRLAGNVDLLADAYQRFAYLHKEYGPRSQLVRDWADLIVEAWGKVLSAAEAREVKLDEIREWIGMAIADAPVIDGDPHSVAVSNLLQLDPDSTTFEEWMAVAKPSAVVEAFERSVLDLDRGACPHALCSSENHVPRTNGTVTCKMVEARVYRLREALVHPTRSAKGESS